METAPSREEWRSAAVGDEAKGRIFLKYYTDKDYISSLEGVLKVSSAVVCVVLVVLSVTPGAAQCERAPALGLSTAGAALACGAACALLVAGAALGLPLKAPQPYLLTDIIVSTVLGLLLLVLAVLGMAVCEFHSIVSYLHGPLAVLNAGMVLTSAVITYLAVLRLWDASLDCETSHSMPTEHEA